MLTVEHILPFCLAALTLSLIPGPDMLFIMAKTMSDQKRGGFLSLAGISMGLLVHTLAIASGLSLLIVHSELLFKIIKWLGVLYLIYLGGKLLITKQQALRTPEEDHPQHTDWAIFQQGLITNILNPKIIIFFLAFLPQFVTTTTGNTFYQFMILGLLFILIGTCVNGLVVITCSLIQNRLEQASLFRFVQQKVAGMLLIALGLKLAFER